MKIIYGNNVKCGLNSGANSNVPTKLYQTNTIQVCVDGKEYTKSLSFDSINNVYVKTVWHDELGNVTTEPNTALINNVNCQALNEPLNFETSETITPVINTNTINLSNLPDLSKEFEVERNGLTLNNTDYTINGTTITFNEMFNASNGAVFSETITVRYSLL